MANLDALVLLDGNDMLLRVTSKVKSTGAVITGATVDVTLFDQFDKEVGGPSWPLSLSENPGSSGIYEATLPNTMGLRVGQTLRMLGTFDGGSGQVAQFEPTVVVRKRTA